MKIVPEPSLHAVFTGFHSISTKFVILFPPFVLVSNIYFKMRWTRAANRFFAWTHLLSAKTFLRLVSPRFNILLITWHSVCWGFYFSFFSLFFGKLLFQLNTDVIVHSATNIWNVSLMIIRLTKTVHSNWWASNWKKK